MFLSIINNDTQYNNKIFPEKYKSLKFESYCENNIKYEYENGEIVIFFTGVVFNTEKLLEWLNIHNNDSHRMSSCPDIIVHIYKNYGFNYMMNAVDGIFSLVLLDQRVNVPESKMYIMRDEVGLKPLFTMIPINDEAVEQNHNMYKFLPNHSEQEKPIHTKLSNLVRGFSTNYTALNTLCAELNDGSAKPKYMIKEVPLGCYFKYIVSNKVSCFWEVNVPPIKTNALRYCRLTSVNKKENVDENVRNYLCHAIEKRVQSLSNTNILCVIDVNNFESVIIACIVNQYLIVNKTTNRLVVIFQDCGNYSLYLKTVLSTEKFFFLPKNVILFDFIAKIEDLAKTTIFSSLFLTINNDIRSKKSCMEIDKELKKSLFELHNVIDRTVDIDIEYPLLDCIWLQYYLSIDLSYKKNLIQESFNYQEFEGTEGTYTLE
jgi:hypothetical protein